jgi:SpoIID/LytB domain protein
LGQYGALGYAIDSGWTAAQILGHYYSNTTAGSVSPTSPMQVRMTAVDRAPTIVFQEKGHLTTAADDGLPGGRVPHQAIRLDRVGPNSFQVYDGSSCTGPWTPRAAPVASASIGIFPAVHNDDTTEMLQLCVPGGSRWLRGDLYAVEGDGLQRTVNVLPLDDYVRGVVPRESPASWADLGGGKGMQALMSQAVAARSYGYTENRYAYAKTCDTTACQVYGGRAQTINGVHTNLEDARSDSAVAQTSGAIRLLNGAPARTEFSSSTGGYTAGGTFPAVVDDGDDVSLNPNHNWTSSIPVSSIEATYNKGTFQSASVTSRNGLGEDGGRVLNLRLTFSGGTVDVTGSAFQSAFGLRSNWFVVTNPALNFDPFDNLGGSLASAPTATSWSTGHLDVFARGAGNDLQHRWYEAGWKPWEGLGGALTSAPAAEAWGAGRLDVFARGTDNALWHRFYENGWSNWESLGGVLIEGPAVASWAQGRLDVFVPGTDHAIWHKSFQAGWSGWDSIGGVVNEPAAAVSWSSGRIDLFARGSNNALWHRFFQNGWSNWESLGGTLTSSPTVSSWGPQRLDVFARGNDNSLNHLWFDAGWKQWHSLGGTLTSAPGATSWGINRVDVFVRGTDNAMWHTAGST